MRSQLESLKAQAATTAAATIDAVNDTKQAVNTAASEAAERDAVLLAKQQEGFQMVSAQLEDISRQAIGSTQSILSAIELHGSGDSQLMQEKMDKRHNTRPGLTGLAQIRGYRGDTPNSASIHNRINSDIEYINRQSFLLDLEIITISLWTLIRAAMRRIFN